MSTRSLPRLLMLVAATLGLWPVVAAGQVLGSLRGGQFELAEQVQLSRADNTVLANLQRVQAYLDDHQWSEAVETLRQVMESAGGMLMPVTERRYVSVRDYCHLRLSQMPQAALSLYRSRIDPVAQKWYEDGIRRLDQASLTNVVEQAFASSFGDRALWALGEMRLEAGDYAAARTAWERVLRVEPPPGVAATWLCYPDSRFDPAAVRARLTLVSILEGATERARGELAQFARLHRDARGVFGGQEVNYLAALESLLAENSPDRRDRPCADWPTFAGNGVRSQIAADVLDVGHLAWRRPLFAQPSEQTPQRASAARGMDEATTALSCHPTAWGGLVAAATNSEILVFDARTGRPAWNGSVAAAYRDQFDEVSTTSDPSDSIGTPRWTVTIHNGKLLARVGTAITSRPPNSTFRGHPACLVCLDLKAEGRLLWKVYPDEGWAWEGSPLVDGPNVYVAMRRSDIRPQAHVACLDAQTGQLRWRRFICAADSPAHGILHESTHQLLTLAGDTLYYNTNLGAVAAVATGSGQIRWVSLYPRVRQGDLARLAPHWQRDLTPCVFHRGLLLVAPADSPRIFGLEAATGQILWQTGTQLEDAIHLLGVTDDWLIASGRRLYWISLKPGGQGRVERIWPQSNERLGYGRGILAGQRIYWPAREKIFRFNLRSAQPEKVIDLAPLGLTGGNLIASAGRLLLATPTELVALDTQAGVTPTAPGLVGREPPGAPSTAQHMASDATHHFPRDDAL